MHRDRRRHHIDNRNRTTAYTSQHGTRRPSAGLLTIALALLAWDLAGPDARMVLGTALAIKMVAYVGLAPVAAALTQQVLRRAMLITLDLIRAGIALMLPFVTEVWQIYVLIFLLQAASAGFTPTFQATIPDVLPNERDYTRALSLSRLAYDLENLVSPLLAAALLMFVSFSLLFVGTVFGFLVSAALVLSVVLPSPHPGRPRGIRDRTTRGLRLYLASPRLRGLLALNLALAAAGSMVMVNTVVIVQAGFGLASSYVALAMAAFGGGSVVAALTLPRLLDRIADRPVMLAGAAMLVVGLSAGSFLSEVAFAPILGLWVVLGFGYAIVQNTEQAPPAPFIDARGPPGSLCRTIRPHTSLLVDRLSAGRCARRTGWYGGNVRHARSDRRRLRPSGDHNVAARRRDASSARTSRIAHRPPAPTRTWRQVGISIDPWRMKPIRD